jgi:hypothetical protein
MEIVWLILFGVIGGVLGGMGMGGGTLLIPLLTIFAGIEQQIAQGINLIAFVPMAVIALIIHTKNKLVNYKIGLPIVIAGVLSSVGGAFLANVTNSLSLRVYFGIFLIILGIMQIASIFLFPSSTKNRVK